MNISDEKSIKTRSPSLDGLRGLACIGIMLMHLQANTNYVTGNGFIYSTFIPSFTHLVILFLMLSGYGMCAGYLRKFQDKSIDLEQFYIKRYKRLLPFFIFLILIGLIMKPGIHTLYDAFMECTMLYGLLPNNALTLIGVGWTVGVIFLFYLLFPAFTILLKNKKRAWTSLAISLFVVFMCNQWYFTDYYVNDLFTPRHNFLYCLPCFIAGGLVYLYNDSIINIMKMKWRWLLLVVCVGGGVAYYALPSSFGGIDFLLLKNLVLFSMILVYFIGVDSIVLCNPVMNFLGNISMELYLCHMFIFRGLEKTGMIYRFSDGSLGYWTIAILMLFGVIALVMTYRLLWKVLTHLTVKIRNRKYGNSTATI